MALRGSRPLRSPSVERNARKDRKEHLAPSVMSLTAVRDAIISCERCPRLRTYCAEIARTKKRAYCDDIYWGRPVPGFGDPAARVYLLGLAPAAHGGNRTGRVFTGDTSGNWLMGSLHRTGFASQPTSLHRNDGLRLDGAFIGASVRCAPPGNRPLPEERDNCLPYAAEELRLMPSVRVIVCLGSFAWDAALRLSAMLGEAPVRPRPRFGHGAEHELGDGRALVGSYHPSQQNTFTGKLTEAMMDAVFARARELATAEPL
jgi:uracil-DNA glycosylase